MSNEILSEQDGGILRVTINRPDAGNAMTDAMALELTAIIEAAPKTSRMVLLRGAGADFCVGRAAPPPPAHNPEALERRRFSDIVFNTYGAIRDCRIPVVCVVQGRALGFGCAVAAVADITLASENATFQVPEMLHNILPTMVMSALADPREPQGARLSRLFHQPGKRGTRAGLRHRQRRGAARRIGRGGDRRCAPILFRLPPWRAKASRSICATP